MDSSRSIKLLDSKASSNFPVFALSLKINFAKSRWHNSLFGNEAEEWTVAKYIFKMNKEIVAIYKRLRRSKEEDSYHIAVIDKNSIGFVVHAMDGFDVIIDIPNTKMAILMLQWKK